MIAGAVALWVGLSAAHVPTLTLAEDKPGIAYSSDPKFVFLLYRSWGSGMPDRDLLIPRLQIYGSGRTVSYRASYLSHPGLSEMVLEREEIDQLLRKLAEDGMC